VSGVTTEPLLKEIRPGGERRRTPGEENLTEESFVAAERALKSRAPVERKRLDANRSRGLMGHPVRRGLAHVATSGRIVGVGVRRDDEHRQCEYQRRNAERTGTNTKHLL
jgi:hypothetical protein